MDIDIESGPPYPQAPSIRLYGIHGIAEYARPGPTLSPLGAGLKSCFIVSSTYGALERSIERGVCHAS